MIYEPASDDLIDRILSNQEKYGPVAFEYFPQVTGMEVLSLIARIYLAETKLEALNNAKLETLKSEISLRIKDLLKEPLNPPDDHEIDAAIFGPAA